MPAKELAPAGGDIPQWFFVLAIRNKLSDDGELVVARNASRPIPLAHVIVQSKLIERALEAATPKNRVERVVGSLELERPAALRDALRG